MVLDFRSSDRLYGPSVVRAGVQHETVVRTRTENEWEPPEKDCVTKLCL